MFCVLPYNGGDAKVCLFMELYEKYDIGLSILIVMITFKISVNPPPSHPAGGNIWRNLYSTPSPTDINQDF